VYNPINGKILAQGYNKKDLCLSTSGNYRREHIIGKGSNTLQVTVAYEDCTLTDGLFTALFAMNDKKDGISLKNTHSLTIFCCFLTVLFM